MCYFYILYEKYPNTCQFQTVHWHTQDVVGIRRELQQRREHLFTLPMEPADANDFRFAMNSFLIDLQAVLAESR